jgi:seryl-tRNA synthetase
VFCVSDENKIMTFHQSDSRREEFRKYLEKAGVLDALSKALVGLYEESERPSDALEYLRQHLQIVPDSRESEGLKQEVTDLLDKMENLKIENEELKTKLQKVETAPPGNTQQ